MEEWRCDEERSEDGLLRWRRDRRLRDGGRRQQQVKSNGGSEGKGEGEGGS